MTVPVPVKVGAFALAIMGSYSWYANSIPQIESKPPEELSLEGGNVSPQQLVAAGEKIFREKGQCTTCHGIGRAGRGPDLAGMGGRAATRKPGTKAAAYLVESLLDPNAFVVEGFSKPSIMPNVSKPPIGLNRSEVWATAAFLESLGGTVDVKLDDVPQIAVAQGGGAASIELPGDAKAGEGVYTGKGACVACHKAGAIGASPVGPDLSNIAGSQTPEYIMAKILDPASKGTVSGFPPNVMPKTFGQQLTAKEYLDLVSFLLTLKGGAAPAGAGQPAAKAKP
ncbi:MAG TPA: c-type cytochrome [Methylomirabilota bacterium]|nr:c-type cytochrome [Methylomirabilota bacterium]